MIKIGAIGVGSRLRRLIALLLQQQGSSYEFVAVADEAPEALEDAKKIFETFQKEKAPVLFSDYRQLLAIGEIEWVMIGSRNHLHVSHVCDSFAAGKHVFCEKPLAISVDECVKIRECQSKYQRSLVSNHASDSGSDVHGSVKSETSSGLQGGSIQEPLLFATGFVLRHSLLYSNIYRIVREEKLLGKLVSVEANETLHPAHGGYIMRNWRRFKELSGPHILEKTCHDLDILSWLIGSIPTHVSAFGGQNIFLPENAPEKDLDYYKLWPQAYEEIDPFTSEKTIEDNVVAIMRYRNGVHCSFHTNACTAWPQRRILICGIKGTLQADLITSQISYQLIGPNQPIHVIDITNSDSHGGGDDLIVSDLARSMADHSTPKATGEEGFISALICLAIDQARESMQVVDMEPIWKKFHV